MADVDALLETLTLQEKAALTAGEDLFSTIGVELADALAAVAVQATQLMAPDVLHGHINSPWLAQAQRSYADMAEWLVVIATRAVSDACGGY